MALLRLLLFYTGKGVNIVVKNNQLFCFLKFAIVLQLAKLKSNGVKCNELMTSKRDNEITSLRPSVEVNIDKNEANSPGHFQNATLRPILKLQNELLLQMFNHYLDKYPLNNK